MLITIPRSELKQAISGLSRVIPRKATLPVLECVRFSVQDGKARASGTDLDADLAFTFQEARCEDQGVAVVPLAELQALTKGKDNEPVTIKAGGQALIEVTNTLSGQQVVRRFNGIDPAEWPQINPTVGVGPVDPAFLANLRRVAPFTSDDESRRVLTGVFLDTGKSDYMVATDGRRMTALNTLKFPFTKSCIVPASKFLTWGKLETETLLIGYGEVQSVGWFRLVTPSWDYKVRTYDGTYPNWRQVVPGGNGKHRLVIGDEDAALLATVLPTFAGHDTHCSPVTIRGVNGKVQISGCGQNDKAPTTMELPGSRMEGGEAQTSLDRHYWLDALAAGFRSFAFEDSISPLMAKDAGGGVHVMMPMRTGSAPAKTEAPKVEAAKPVDPPVAVHVPEPKEKPMSKTTETPAAQPQGNALDRVLAAYELARTKGREANEALATVAVAVKEALREDKQRRSEIESVRAGLARLQSIKV